MPRHGAFPDRLLACPLRRRAASLLLAAVLACSLSSCLRLSWSRQTLHRPIPAEAIDGLQSGDDLASCLELLGAPLLVRELGDGAFALAYGWLDERQLGINVSVPVGDNYSASLDYDQLDRRVRGVVLFLDGEQRLVLIRRGVLRDLLAEADRRRPAFDPRWGTVQ